MGKPKDKTSLESALQADVKKPIIRRGKGLQLSTDTAQEEQLTTPDAVSHNREIAESQNRTLAETLVSPAATVPPPAIPVPSVPVTVVQVLPGKPANTSAETKRINRGYKLREDLVKAYKRLAIDDDLALYEVMEVALIAYLTERKRWP